MSSKILSFYGMKFNPFSSDVPAGNLWLSDEAVFFLNRVKNLMDSGGFALISGDPGSGKSSLLRYIAYELSQNQDIKAGIISRPQSNLSDFYRELGAQFGLHISHCNRWQGFNSLRQQWLEHIAATLYRPVIFIDEAQIAKSAILDEIRLLSSMEMDSKNALSVILVGDKRICERLRKEELTPLNTRIKARIHLGKLEEDEAVIFLEYMLEQAGNTALMTGNLIKAICAHCAGNLRSLAFLAEEIMNLGFSREISPLNEKLYFEISDYGARKQKKPSQRSEARL